MCKCQFPGGIDIKPDGINSLDPCIYKTEEIYVNVTVEIRRCVRCGCIDIAWTKQEDTEKVVGADG